MSDMKWTYVKDRLPEEDGDYIVATMYSVTDRRDGATYGARHTVCDIAISSFEDGEFSNELVYAWMPKPPLPSFPDDMPDDEGQDEGANIIPIEVNMPHKVSEVMCVRCVRRWIDVRPVGLQLKDLMCAGCGQTGGVIETGEDIREEDWRNETD